LVLDRSALAHNLKPLERDGLLKIIVDRNDKRSRLVKLTARGEQKLGESMGLWEKAQHRFETAFGSEQARALRASLALISSAEFA
jgi:DNA-binding MarR family transcriptional regulator